MTDKITGSIITDAATGYYDEHGNWHSISSDWPTQVILKYSAYVNASNKIQVDYSLVSSAGDGEGYKWVKMGIIKVKLDGVEELAIEGRETVYQNETLWSKEVIYDPSDSGKTINIYVGAAIYSGSINCEASGSFKLPIAALTVTFDKNGGNSVNPASKTVTLNENYGTLATATRTGYNFDGWYTAKTGGTKIESTTKVTQTSSHTLYAHWTANSYTLTFNVNDSSDYPADSFSTTSITVTYDSVYKNDSEFPKAEPVRKGFNFDGWYTAKTGGTRIESTTKVSTASNHTLYAQWTEFHITINYYANGANSATFQGSSKDVSKVLLSHEIKYTEKADLYNYNNESQLNIKKYKHIARSGAQWNTSPNGQGSGTGISQGVEKTGQEWGVFFGKPIDSENKSQNIYVDWVPYGVIRVYVKDQGWKLGVPYVYSKSDNAWKETFPYIYDSKFGNTDGWKPGQ